MTINEQSVADHYGKGGLLNSILSAVADAGGDPANITHDDLKPIEEFHIGGREATAYTTQKMALTPKTHMLDIGCGIGGAARFIHHQYGARVSGVDLTPEYIEVARALNEKLGIGDALDLRVASALELPFEDQSFDGALTMHVAMNIKDRPKLYAEAARVLKPGAIFAIYDVMKKGDAPIAFPVPWSSVAQTSHLTTPDEMRVLLGDAGFEILDVEDRTEFAKKVFEKGQLAVNPDPKTPSVHAIMGASAPEKVKNLRANVKKGAIGPVQIIARKI